MNDKIVAIKASMAAALTAITALLGWRGLLLVCWVVGMALDWISGSAKGALRGKWSSTVAREGLFHKAGMMISVLVAAFTDVGIWATCQVMPVQFKWNGYILPLVLMWYIFTEFGSILENAMAMGAPVPDWLPKIMQAGKEIVNKSGEASVPEKGENQS